MQLSLHVKMFDFGRNICYAISISRKLMTDIKMRGDYLLGISIKSKQRLGKKIKNQRDKINFSQRKLAMDCGITPQSLSDIEKGINFPSVDVFMKLVNVARFGDKEKMYDLYGALKGTAPPDILEFLTNNEEIVGEIRQKIKQKEGEL